MADYRSVVSPLGQKTIKHVAEQLEAGESAGLSEIVELIQRLSSSAYETSIQELSVLIGRDVVVTARVIAAANTLGYNPAGVAVTTITQAIHVIGFNKIRQLAVSLLLMESANRILNANERRDIAALALCSGLMAESVMNQRGTLSPEEAFICASLRNYGRLLMTAFMIDDYRRAKIMATSGMTEDEAFNRVFGLTPLELGYHLLASAHLPEPILKSLRDLPPDAIRSATQQPDMELLALADLSVKLCELALRSDVGAQEFGVQAKAIAARAGRVFGLDSEALVAILRQTGEQLNEFAHTFGLSALAEQIGPRIHARITGSDPAGYEPRLPSATERQAADAAPRGNGVPPTSADAAGAAERTAEAAPAAPGSAVGTASPGAAAAPEAATSHEVRFQRAFQSGIEQLAGLLDEDPVDMEKIYQVVLRAALQGFACPEVVLWVRDGQQYRAQLGTGGFFQSIRATATVREEEHNVFGLCLQRLEDVLIYDARDPKIVPHLPAWAKTPALASFVLLPVQDNRRPFALLLAGWPEKKTAGFTVSQIRHVRSMLKLVGTARRLADRG